MNVVVGEDRRKAHRSHTSKPIQACTWLVSCQSSRICVCPLICACGWGYESLCLCAAILWYQVKHRRKGRRSWKSELRDPVRSAGLLQSVDHLLQDVRAVIGDLLQDGVCVFLQFGTLSFTLLQLGFQLRNQRETKVFVNITFYISIILNHSIFELCGLIL